MLYFRMLLTMGVSLYTVRVVLNTLGVEDFGIYNVVGGLVALLSFLPGAMASATQRFFSHALGQKDEEKLKKIFGVNGLLYLGIALIALVVLETAGQWFIQNHLNVPSDRLEAAQGLYRFSVLTFVVGVLTSPFMAMIIAHEDMKIYAYVAILEATLKLATVFALMAISGEKIVIYGALVFGVALINSTTYIIICFRRYNECRFRNLYWDKKLAQEILSFTSWTLFGQITTVFRTQAITVLLNQFFNPVIVASRAVAMNVASQSMVLAQNFNVGLYPPIIKAYAANQKEEMFSLIYNGSKIAFFLMWIVVLPLFIETEAILQIWLKKPPEYAVVFTQLAMAEVLITALSHPLATAARAPGKMAAYEGLLGSIQIGIFLVSWIIVRAGAEAHSVFIIAIVANLIMFWVRLILVRSLISLPILEYLRRAIIPIAGMVIASVSLVVGMKVITPSGPMFSTLTIFAAFTCSTLCFYRFGLEPSWREKMGSLIKTQLRVFGLTS